MSFKIGDTLKLVKKDDTDNDHSWNPNMLEIGSEVLLTQEVFDTIFQKYDHSSIRLQGDGVLSHFTYRLSDFGLVMRDGYIALDSGFVQGGDVVTVLDANLAVTIDTLVGLISEGNEYVVASVYPDENTVMVRLGDDELSARMPLNFEGLAMKVLEDTDVEVAEEETDEPLADATFDYSDVEPSDFEDICIDDYVVLLSDADTVFYDGVNEQDLAIGESFIVIEVDSHDQTVLVDAETNEVWIHVRALCRADELPDDAIAVVAEQKSTEDEPEEETVQIATSITDDSVTIVINGHAELINFDDENFEEVRQLVFDKKIKEALALINVGAAIENFGQGALQIENGIVSYNGQPIVGALVSRIINMMKIGDDTFKPLAKFLNLVLEQQSLKTRERLMEFAAHGTLDITDEGHIIAFKNVRDDYMDKHSGNFRNQVGDSPSMNRADVDDDHNNQCSVGLHVCAPEYLFSMWGTNGRTMRVSVDPRDMIAVPFDYNNTKARTCKYTVIEDVTDRIDEYRTKK